MNINRLYEILGQTTAQLRKGLEVTKTVAGNGGVAVTEHFAMPHVNDARPETIKVDCHFVVVGVNKVAAEQHRAEFIELLNDYPEPVRLAGGPSYIEVGATIGDQGAALQMFALGEVLGLWKVITPAMFHFTGEEADRMAGSGFVLMSGYHQKKDGNNAQP